jgi:uncharacterized protein (UPF0262 family)
MVKKNQWVIKYRNIWAVKGEGNTKVTKITKTQKEAIDIAREIAKNQKSELIIQNTEGKIRSKDSYGNDPYPPKDKEH